ncbi:MAG TPA: peroxiredoxin [Pyrinomonadaceae bacterium]|nr:peroxiredoxin [Pyrinomonadaceae bacterium]
MTGRNHFNVTNNISRRATSWGGVMTLALAAVVSLACASGNASADNPKLAEGSPAPDFTLASDDGRMVKLSEYKGKQSVVLYFYPKDETPGCTKQACSFRDNFKAFKDAGIEVLGVSVDTVDSHKAFKKNQKLNFTLLADDKKEVSKSYGVLSERGYSSRVTFVIDKEGVIRKIYTNVDPVANATETLEFAKTL